MPFCAVVIPLRPMMRFPILSPFISLPSDLLPIFFFFNDTATTEIYTLSLHDALPISPRRRAAPIPLRRRGRACRAATARTFRCAPAAPRAPTRSRRPRSRRAARRLRGRSEEHTSELQSRQYLVCRLLLEKKKKKSRHESRQFSRGSLALLLVIVKGCAYVSAFNLSTCVVLEWCNVVMSGSVCARSLCNDL